MTEDNLDDNETESDIALYQQQQGGNFRVENQTAIVKDRGSAQKIFANQVKLRYANKCCITGIDTVSMLIASHIVPWSVDADNRINPANGLSLSALLDKAFDKGFISFDSNYKMIISQRIEQDIELFSYLNQYRGKKICATSKNLPDQRFLEWHRTNVFKS